jgi:hypothetical protein
MTDTHRDTIMRLMVQAVRKRFSSAKNYTQPVAVHVDTTV